MLNNNVWYVYYYSLKLLGVLVKNANSFALPPQFSKMLGWVRWSSFVSSTWAASDADTGYGFFLRNHPLGGPRQQQSLSTFSFVLVKEVMDSLVSSFQGLKEEPSSLLHVTYLSKARAELSTTGKYCFHNTFMWSFRMHSFSKSSYPSKRNHIKVHICVKWEKNRVFWWID